MLTNDQMIPDRFSRMQFAKRLHKFITESIRNGYRIQVTTYTQSRIYSHESQFKAGKYSVYAQRGKKWDCIDLASVRAVQ